jgi:hypothetical protein
LEHRVARGRFAELRHTQELLELAGGLIEQLDELLGRHRGNPARQFSAPIVVRQHRQHLTHVRRDGAGEAGNSAVIESDDAVRDVEDAVVVRHQ